MDAAILLSEVCELVGLSVDFLNCDDVVTRGLLQVLVALPSGETGPIFGETLDEDGARCLQVVVEEILRAELASLVRVNTRDVAVQGLLAKNIKFVILFLELSEVVTLVFVEVIHELIAEPRGRTRLRLSALFVK